VAQAGRDPHDQHGRGKGTGSVGGVLDELAERILSEKSAVASGSSMMAIRGVAGSSSSAVVNSATAKHGQAERLEVRGATS